MSIKRQESGYVDNWQGRETLTECNLRMLETEDFSDVTFRVGSQQQVVRAHRYVLVSRSCVFHAMFCGPLAEKGEVTIPDIEADIFKEFLRYMYTDEARINAETVTGLMYTSRKYSLDTLYDLCVTFLEESLSEDNVCQILEECHGYGELDLEQKALKILTEGGERVTKSPGFVGLCSECVGKLLKSDTLNLKEKDIFEAVLSWTKERCRKEGVSDTPENRRRLLGDMRIQLKGCQLYGGYDDLEVPVSISLYDQDESEITELDTEMELLGRGQMTDILFSESVLLQPGTTYIVCVEIDVLATEEGPYWGQWEQGGYIGLNGKQTVTTDGVQFTFSNSRYYNTETTALRGNIPGFIFSI
ncbi:BTB/POZ domain-containing protein 6-like isoform X2 [Haliotis rubra]|uniref:BTB/POZ domain-containing protein 6-like isoform X2 n=1 Tax=Haliotis rubra TaxID=36100 RepID=UPI001EE60216|nr:BTB/POZ domain-containing protein 6-like isoform X2 [Haliotis rubra]